MMTPVGAMAGATNYAPGRSGMEARRQRYDLPYPRKTLSGLAVLANKRGSAAIDAFAQAQTILSQLDPRDRYHSKKWMDVIRRNYLAAMSDTAKKGGLFLRADLFKANYVVPARGRIGWDPKDKDWGATTAPYEPPDNVRRVVPGKKPFEEKPAPDDPKPKREPGPSKPKAKAKGPVDKPRHDFDIDHPKSFFRLLQWAEEDKLSDADVSQLAMEIWPSHTWQGSSPEHIREEVVGFLLDEAERRQELGNADRPDKESQGPAEGEVPSPPERTTASERDSRGRRDGMGAGDQEGEGSAGEGRERKDPVRASRRKD